MKRTSFSLLLALVTTISASAQEWANASLSDSPRHHEWITVKNGERTVHAFVAYPEKKKRTPVVIVIHENTGLTDWARSVADQLAAQGYIAIAPDLLSGAGPNGGKTSDFASNDDARKAIGALDPAQVTADLNAIADHAKKLPAANGKVAVSGFCWGGGQTFRFAKTRHDLKAAFVFYGPAPADVSDIKVPVYGFYGENDARINASIPATVDAAKKANVKYDPMIYQAAGHGFMRQGEAPDATEGNKKARKDAWKRWLKLLKKM